MINKNTKLKNRIHIMKKFIFLVLLTFLVSHVKANPLSSASKIELTEKKAIAHTHQISSNLSLSKHSIISTPNSLWMKDDSVKGKLKRAWKKFINFFK